MTPEKLERCRQAEYSKYRRILNGTARLSYGPRLSGRYGKSNHWKGAWHDWLKDAPSLLDIGTGCGDLILTLHNLTKCHFACGVDCVPFWEGRTDVPPEGDGPRRWLFVVANAHELPFPNQSFHTVTAFDALEHIRPEDNLTALGEMARIARERIVLSLPTGPSMIKVDPDPEYSDLVAEGLVTNNLHPNWHTAEEWERCLTDTTGQEPLRFGRYWVCNLGNR